MFYLFYTNLRMEKKTESREQDRYAVIFGMTRTPKGNKPKRKESLERRSKINVFLIRCISIEFLLLLLLLHYHHHHHHHHSLLFLSLRDSSPLGLLQKMMGLSLYYYSRKDHSY